MRLAIVHHESSVGGWAYLTRLVEAMTRLDAALDVTIFYNRKNLEWATNLAALNAKNIALMDFRFTGGFRFEEKRKTRIEGVDYLINKYRRRRHQSQFTKIERVFRSMPRFDVVLYTWPYRLEPLRITCGRQYFIPHDFIYTHCFSTNALYTREDAEAIYESHAKFLKVATPIVSTNFIARELKRTFPEYVGRVHVVYLSYFNDMDEAGGTGREATLSKHGLGNEYILSANNSSVHKNIGQIASAMYYVKKKYPGLQLALTGPGTQDFTGMINSPLYSDWFFRSDTPDIMGLGMVDDKDFCLILKNARLVVTTSLCEAGSGSGLDAWRMGVPFVAGDIPAIREQVDFLQTRAEFCDPRNSTSIAGAILRVLDNRDAWKKNAELSKIAMRNYTWDDVAKGYSSIFRGDAP